MFQGVRLGWLLTFVFTAYICLDFSSPFVAGAFQFDADQSVDGIVMKASEFHRDGLRQIPHAGIQQRGGSVCGGTRKGREFS